MIIRSANKTSWMILNKLKQPWIWSNRNNLGSTKNVIERFSKFATHLTSSQVNLKNWKLRQLKKSNTHTINVRSMTKGWLLLNNYERKIWQSELLNRRRKMSFGVWLKTCVCNRTSKQNFRKYNVILKKVWVCTC